MPHIFISYSKKDTRQLALDVRAALMELSGVTAWMDDSLYSGEDWAVQIQDEIDRCDSMVVLLSPDVNRPATSQQTRSFVLREINYAQQINKPIIPIMAQPTRVPVQIAGIQYIDFTRDQAVGIRKLSQEINQRAGISVEPPIELPPSVPGRSALLRYGLVGFGVVLAFAVIFALLFPTLNNNLNSQGETPIVTSVATDNTMLRTDAPTFDAQVATKIMLDRTATATLWTATPTATFTPTPTVTSTSTPLPGYPGGSKIQISRQWKVVQEAVNGVDMVLVPAGCFEMGSTDGANDDQPVNGQCFNQPFWIDRTEVTNAQFAAFRGGAANWSNWTNRNRPRENITWFEARDYCALRAARLPTEAEWEYAARGPDDLKYPWGDDFVADNVVYTSNSNSQTADVGSKPDGKSWVGALDMSGNVWEWVSSLYRDYPYQFDDGREDGDNRTDYRILRGGSWGNIGDFLRASDRSGVVPTLRDNSVGLRCARDYEG